MIKCVAEGMTLEAAPSGFFATGQVEGRSCSRSIRLNPIQ
jgi:hypothetical protein